MTSGVRIWTDGRTSSDARLIVSSRRRDDIAATREAFLPRSTRVWKSSGTLSPVTGRRAVRVALGCDQRRRGSIRSGSRATWRMSASLAQRRGFPCAQMKAGALGVTGCPRMDVSLLGLHCHKKRVEVSRLEGECPGLRALAVSDPGQLAAKRDFDARVLVSAAAALTPGRVRGHCVPRSCPVRLGSLPPSRWATVPVRVHHQTA